MPDKERLCDSGVCVSHFGNVRRHKVVQCVEMRLVYGLFLQNDCEKKIQIKINKKKKTQKYSHRGSNSGPLACEASVITN